MPVPSPPPATLREIAGVSVAEIAREFGTPTYVYDAAKIVERLGEVSAFDVVRYAQKACSSLAIVDLVRRHGALVDTVSYGELLDVFWGCHNPTTLNRQGPDHGSQYRSVIFTFDDGQRADAEKSKAAQDASGAFPAPIVTAIEPASTYWRAEDYHQNYFKKEGIEACPI